MCSPFQLSVLGEGSITLDPPQPPEGEIANMPMGVKIHASGPAWFGEWYTTGSLLSGSPEATDSFILTQNTEIWGHTKSVSGFEYPDREGYRISVSVAGGDEPLLLSSGPGRPGKNFMRVREGTLISVEAIPLPFGDTWLRLRLDFEREGNHTFRHTVADPDPFDVIERTSGTAPHGYGQFSVKVSSGLGLASMTSHGTPFVESVRFRIPYGEGVTWESETDLMPLLQKGYYVYSATCPPASNGNPRPVALVDARAMNVLTLKAAECEEGCICDQHGSASIKNPKRYYVGRTASVANGELVGVSVRANPGHVVKGLLVDGGGRVFRWEGDGPVVDFMSLEDMTLVEPNEDGLYEGDEAFYVEMAASATVTPVVCLCSHEGGGENGWLIGDTPFGPLTEGVGRYGTNRDTDKGGDDWGCLHYIEPAPYMPIPAIAACFGRVFSVVTLLIVCCFLKLMASWGV